VQESIVAVLGSDLRKVASLSVTPADAVGALEEMNSAHLAEQLPAAEEHDAAVEAFCRDCLAAKVSEMAPLFVPTERDGTFSLQRGMAPLFSLSERIPLPLHSQAQDKYLFNRPFRIRVLRALAACSPPVRW
jgi:hypothetical protein